MLIANRTESSCWFRFVFSRPELNWADIERSATPKTWPKNSFFTSFSKRRRRKFTSLEAEKYEKFLAPTPRRHWNPTSIRTKLSFLEMLSNYIIFIFLYVKWKLYSTLGICFTRCFLLFASKILVRQCEGVFEAANTLQRQLKKAKPRVGVNRTIRNVHKPSPAFKDRMKIIYEMIHGCSQR